MRHQQRNGLINSCFKSFYMLLVVFVYLLKKAFVQSGFVTDIIFVMHECLDLFHLVFVLRRLFLTNMIRVLFSFFDILRVSIKKGFINIINHLFVFDTDVIFECNCKIFVLQKHHQLVVGNQLGE